MRMVMRHTARRLIVPALAAALMLAAFATGAVHGQSGPRERTVFVSAVDAKGEPVEGLGAADFIVREDGRRREVLRVSRAVEPIDIVLLVDNSAAAEDAIQPMREGLSKFVSAMTPSNQIAIVALADRPTLLVDYTSDSKRLETGIGRIFSQSMSGMTLLDALVEVSSGLQKRESTRAVILPIITDGTEFTNRYSRDVIAAIKQANAGLHVIAIGTFAATDDVRRERGLVLDLGPRSTGGQRVTLLSETAIGQALQKIGRELSSQYKVVYGRPESFLPPETLDVESGRAGVTMRGTPARGQTGA
jgi:VWFA-related protein